MEYKYETMFVTSVNEFRDLFSKGYIKFTFDWRVQGKIMNLLGKNKSLNDDWYCEWACFHFTLWEIFPNSDGENITDIGNDLLFSCGADYVSARNDDFLEEFPRLESIRNAVSFNLLGRYFFECYPDDEDKRGKGLFYLEKSAELGNVDAICFLASMFAQGIKPYDRNPEKAISYYVRAAKMGSYLACMRLAEIYYRGEIVDRDLTEALLWLDDVKHGFDTDDLKEKINKELN